MRFASASLLAALLVAPVLAWGQTAAPAPAGRAAVPPSATAPALAPTTAPSTTTPSAAAPATRRGARAAAPGAAAGMADEAAAKQKCGADPVVWGNPSSKVYHTTESRYFGKTKRGSYMCQKDADAAGFHASKSSTARVKKTGATS